MNNKLSYFFLFLVFISIFFILNLDNKVWCDVTHNCHIYYSHMLQLHDIEKVIKNSKVDNCKKTCSFILNTATKYMGFKISD